MTLKEGGGGGTEGWYGCLDFLSLTGGMEERLITSITLAMVMTAVDTLVAGPGSGGTRVMSGPTSKAVNYRINKCKDECDRDCTLRTMTLIAPGGDYYGRRIS